MEGTYRESLIELARKARERTWWSEYRDVMRSNYIGLEAGASTLLAWEPAIIPGLLQTEGYMRALMWGHQVGDRPARVSRFRAAFDDLSERHSTSAGRSP